MFFGIFQVCSALSPEKFIPKDWSLFMDTVGRISICSQYFPTEIIG